MGKPLGGVGVGLGGVFCAITASGRAIAMVISKRNFFMINYYSVNIRVGSTLTPSDSLYAGVHNPVQLRAAC